MKVKLRRERNRAKGMKPCLGRNDPSFLHYGEAGGGRRRVAGTVRGGRRRHGHVLCSSSVFSLDAAKHLGKCLVEEEEEVVVVVVGLLFSVITKVGPSLHIQLLQNQWHDNLGMLGLGFRV